MDTPPEACKQRSPDQDSGICDFYDGLGCIANSTAEGAAGGGAPGGKASSGGRGGGGAGGLSYAVYVAAGGAFEHFDTALSHGLQGEGGLPGGPDGAAGDQYQEP